MTVDPVAAPDEGVEVVVELRPRRPGGSGRRALGPDHSDRPHRRDRGQPRVRPGRHDREPSRGHQEPRDLRGAGRPGADHGPPGDGGPEPHPRPDPLQAGGGAEARRHDLRRPVVRSRCPTPCGPSPTRPRSTSPATSACASTRARAPSSDGARRTPSTSRSSPPTARAIRFSHEAAKGFCQLWGLPLGGVGPARDGAHLGSDDRRSRRGGVPRTRRTSERRPTDPTDRRELGRGRGGCISRPATRRTPASPTSGQALGRPVPGSTGPALRAPERVAPVRPRARPLRSGRLARPRAHAGRHRGAHPGGGGRAPRGPRPGGRGGGRGHLRLGPAPTRTSTWPSSVASPRSSDRWAARCTPAAAATTRSPSTCSSTCGTRSRATSTGSLR